MPTSNQGRQQYGRTDMFVINSPDDFLNGSAAYPVVAPVAMQQGATPASTTVGINRNGPTASGSTILFAWIALLAFLVLAHVMTLSLQR